MIKVYCDICGRLLKKDCSDQVNLNFNAYGVTGFKTMEVNLCVPCAEFIVSKINNPGEMRADEVKKGVESSYGCNG